MLNFNYAEIEMVKYINQNLNTSHVKLQPQSFSTMDMFRKEFKYISC